MMTQTKSVTIRGEDSLDNGKETDNMVHVRIKHFWIGAALFSAIFMIPSSGMSQSQYQLAYGVFGNGGSSISGNGYSLNSTVGQPGTGPTSGSSVVTDIGFWYLESSAVTGIQSQPPNVPDRFFLYQNYPNPFNPTTTINYQLPAVSHVTLKIYDVLGREVATLVNGKENAGRYTVKFDGSNLASGVYFYRLVAGSYVSVKKFLLLK